MVHPARAEDMSERDQELAWISRALQHAPCGAVVASTRADGAMLFANDEFTAITGYSLSDLPTVQDWIVRAYPDPEYRAEVLGNWERDVSQPGRDVVYRVRCADGDDKHLQLRAGLLPGERMVVTMLDVSEQQRITQALRESEERFRQLADHHPTGLVVHTKGRIVYANRAAAHMGGAWEPGRLLGESVFTFVHPSSLEATKARIATVYAKDGDAGWIESRFQRGDGSPFMVEVASARIDWRGEPAGLVIFNDISRRKQREEDQRQLERRIHEAQRMESLAVLAGGVAHDFNNLLVGILGNADLALMELPAHSTARARLEGIELAARRAAELARQMLAYSGKGRLVVGELDLHSLLREISHLLEATLTRKAVIKYGFADSLPLVRGDATQIRQVVMNLMTNAAEAIEQTSGIISITTGLTRHRGGDPQPAWPGHELTPGHYVTVTVSDTGMGMDEDTLRRIFDPFFTTKFTGRGLGLAAVLGIVKGHGGTIRVHSEPGRGSSFEVLLPALMDSIAQDEDEDEQRDAVEPEPTPTPARTVLIVDDDETVRVVGSAMLAHGGYRVLTASSGHDALEIFSRRSHEIDLVLLDLSMPLMNGEECFEHLRAIDPRIRVLLSSGYNEQDAISRFTGEGLAGFIQKPYRAKALLAAVGQALDPQQP
jgi:two-component system cell cycle sensor histidine kinase/response regulator CckA